MINNLIILKNNDTLNFQEFNFRCSIGKKGLTSNKIEGDKKTPIGVFKLGNLFYRKDRVPMPKTNLKKIPIVRNMGWCNDPCDKNNYNKLININSIIKYEVLFRKDYKYNFFIPIKCNTKNKPYKGSAIFIHLTNNYKPTAGCIALDKKDFKILIKIIDKNTKIKIS
ncbi:L,D-transpeptidase family protein [Candidatus Pelagibacter communis]|uniref:L,D-transpeptidase family protein n=1 Tax=Pelagibacter ubique TaxID=198252 RepID=UPI00094D5132|nr:L,D-transpeptidase family protein [Candidatus Pelagibacter ubique]